MPTRKSRFLLLPMAFVLLAPLCQATSESTVSSTPSTPNFSEAASYVLTPEAFQKFLKAEEKLSSLMERDNRLEKAIALKGDHDTFEAWLRRIETNSRAVSAIEEAGLTTREYLKTFVAVVQAYAMA